MGGIAGHRWISHLLMSVGALWLWYLIHGAWDQIRSFLAEARWEWLVISALLCAMSLLPSAEVYRRLLRVHGGLDISFGQAARLHFVGQMVRHLPGRFWGVVYQLNETHTLLETHRLLRLTLDFSLLHLMFNLLVPIGVIIGFSDHPEWAPVVFLGGGVIGALGFHGDWWGWWLGRAQYLVPTRFAHYGHILARRVGYRWQDIIWLFSAILFGWGLYLLAWQALAMAFQGFGAVNFLILGAAYGLAWLVGFLSLLTPSGLAVREAVFVMLTAPLADPGLLAVLALFIRLWLLSADLLLCVIFIRHRSLPSCGSTP